MSAEASRTKSSEDLKTAAPRIALGADHGGYPLKEAIKAMLDKQGTAYRDFGTDSTIGVDYIPYAKLVGEAVAAGECSLGILCCGTGLGMSIAANKICGIRAACCADWFSAKMTREHNDANVLCLGARVTGEDAALTLVDVFLRTPFSGDERHARRIAQITALEQA
ncbi:MAG: ribose 5-phosphate isomerase B [Oscillospiraceae bacterium]|jgi:ribose 5-phosphate isomerase B|nr:ribose 5-phosphate isomerase B [Oscillospiraceae bacterium]